MRPDQVIIHIIDPGRIQDTHAHLTDTERQRAASFRSKADSDHWAACRAGLRLVLAQACGIAAKDVPIVLGPNGKPLLAPPFDHIHFNLSHCTDLALVALALNPVGIDLERSDRAPQLLGCEETFCHPDELEALPAEMEPRGVSLLEIWTSKESVLKALGTGFFLPPEEVVIQRNTVPGNAASHHHEELLTDLHIHRLGHIALAAHTAFVTVSTTAREITFNTDFI